LFVGLTEKFVEEAGSAYSHGENARQKSGAEARSGFPEQQHHNDEQQQSFEACLVELAWVTRVLACARVREDHRPWYIGNPAPKLAIVEIGKAAQHHAHRHADGDIVAHPQEIELAAQRHPEHRNTHTNQPAVEAHASIPHAQKLPADKAIAREIGEGRRNTGIAPGVERRISKPPAKDHA